MRRECELTLGYSASLICFCNRAVSYNPQPLKSLRIIPVMVEDLLLVSTGDRLSMDKPVPFARLATEPLILPSTRLGLRLIMDECARQAGIALDASIEADSF